MSPDTREEVDRLTERFLADLREDHGEMVNFMLWCLAEHLKPRLRAQVVPEGAHPNQANSMVLVAVMETLRERGCSREEVQAALKAGDGWMHRHWPTPPVGKWEAQVFELAVTRY